MDAGPPEITPDEVEDIPSPEVTKNSSPDGDDTIDLPTKVRAKMLGGNELIELIGRGGMGEVWVAYDPRLHRKVAIKVLRHEFIGNEIAVGRFAREAKMVAQLTHSNIIQIYHVGDEDGQVFLVMEWADGGSVSEQLEREGTMMFQDARRVIAQCVEGLEYAFSKGIIHRDIKPGNILLKDGGVKIADFGLAKMITSETQMTMTGTVVGSPLYIAPEQAKGHQTDLRSDIYSLGITFYQLLLGHTPFRSDDALTLLYHHVNDPVPITEPLARLGGGAVARMITRMTAKSPEDRYASYEELRIELTRLTDLGEIGRLEYQPDGIFNMPTMVVGNTIAGGVVSPPALHPAEAETWGKQPSKADGPGSRRPTYSESYTRPPSMAVHLMLLMSVVALIGAVIYFARSPLMEKLKAAPSAVSGEEPVEPTETPSAPEPIPAGATTLAELTKRFRNKNPLQVEQALGPADFTITDEKKYYGALAYRGDRWDTPIYDEATGKIVPQMLVVFIGDTCIRVERYTIDSESRLKAEAEKAVGIQPKGKNSR